MLITMSLTLQCLFVFLILISLLSPGTLICPGRKSYIHKHKIHFKLLFLYIDFPFTRLFFPVTCTYLICSWLCWDLKKPTLLQETDLYNPMWNSSYLNPEIFYRAEPLLVFISHRFNSENIHVIIVVLVLFNIF